MRNRSRLTSLVVLASVVALVGCASARQEYMTAHGYDPAVINAQDYYCNSELQGSGRGPVVMRCLSHAELDAVRSGKQEASRFWPPSCAPATAFDLTGGYLAVIAMIDAREWFCSQVPEDLSVRFGSRLRSHGSTSHLTCYSSPTVAEATVKAIVRARDLGTWMPMPSEEQGTGHTP